MTRVFTGVLLLIATFLSGCLSPYMVDAVRPERGHLIIVGGGLKDENAPIFNRFESLCADGPIGIIPLASGDGIKAGEEVAERWRRYSATRRVVVIPLTQNDAAKANDPNIAAQIASCGGLWFTGGDQSRITRVLRPDPGTSTACYAACYNVLRRNGVIGGTSAGTAMMSTPMITGGRSASAKSAKSDDPDNPGDHHVTTAHGMGFFNLGLTDQHFLQRGRLGRLIDAMRDTGVHRGFGVSENCAIIVDRSTGNIEAMGDEHAVWILDATAPNALTPTGATLRVSILASGDVAQPESGHYRVRPRAPAKDVRADSPSGAREVVSDVWSRASLMPVLNILAKTGSTAGITRTDGHTLLTFSADEQTSIYVGIPGRTPCFSNLRLTIEPDH